MTLEHSFGWRRQLPDHRDLIYNQDERVLYAAQLPLQGGPLIQEPALLPRIWNQTQIGSCTAHGTVRGYVAWLRKEGVKVDEPPAGNVLVQAPFSRLQQYWDSRDIEGNAAFDAGATVRDAIKATAQFGLAPETLWQYDITKFAEQPPPKVFQAAKQHLAFKYQQVVLGPGAPMRTALVNGHCIVFGFAVPSSFEDGSWDPGSGEPLPLPGPGERFIGGHCVAATAFDFECKFTSGPYGSYKAPPFFICDNSWDETWGMEGRFNLHADWFGAKLATDLWVYNRVS